MNRHEKIRIAIAGGGTGGHLFPGLNLGKAMEREWGAQLLFFGTERGIEKTIFPKDQYDLILLPVRGFRRQITMKNLLFPFYLLRSLIICRRTLRRFKPHLVVGTGGYVMGPVLYSAKKLGIPIVIQEQNSYPGVTTRMLAKDAEFIFLAYDEAQRYLPRQINAVLTGNPINLPNVSIGKKDARLEFDLLPEKKTILVVGGSQGAENVNHAIMSVLESGQLNHDVQWLWQTGKNNFEKWRQKVDASEVEFVKVVPFIDEMYKAYQAADLIICRAGAMTLSELIALGKPAVLIPNPHASSDHQVKNALALAKKGAAMVVTDDNHLAENLQKTLTELMSLPEKIKDMAEKMKALYPGNSIENILHILEGWFKKRGIRIQKYKTSVFKRKKHFHFIGIGGIGMSGLAEILLSLGHRVSGSDRQLSEITEYLKERGAKIYEGHHADNIRQADFIIYSSAIHEDNPEMVRARELGIPTMRRAELLGQIFNRHFGIAVAGTHGKTTTTAMIGQVLLNAMLDPTIIVGGRLRNLMTNARLGKSEYLIAEADEYDRSFLTLFPRIAVITSLEADHLDIYKDLDDLKQTFVRFTDQVTFDGVIICCNEAPHLKTIRDSFKNATVTYGLNSQADIWADNIKFGENFTRFVVRNSLGKIGEITLAIPGEHNVLNALAAVAVGLELEIDFDIIAGGLAEFRGVERRFDIHGIFGNIMVVDDYAHHPTEIKATLQAAKKGWKRRIVAVFQPHLYSRTQDFYKEFAEALQLADVAVVTDIYPAREEPIPGVTGQLISDAMGEKGHFVESDEALFNFLKEELHSGDMVIFLGAGSINRLAKEFTDQLKKMTNHG